MGIVDIIKYEGDNTTFVWKHPREDFNTLSQLVVHESQEALLFLNGEALDLFGPGRHTLHTQNIPLLRRIVNIPTGGETPFHCEVYFINKVEQMAIKWGMGDVNFIDPTHNNYAFKIGASGEMSLRIADSRKIVVKLIGTETLFDQEKIKQYFKAPITTHIKTMLPNILRERVVSIFEVEAYLTELSEALKQNISFEMADYGISLEKFWINTILKPESDPFYITLNRQRGEKVTLVNQGEIDKQRAEYSKQVDLIGYSGNIQKKKMDIDTMRYEQEQLGFTYQQQQGFEVMKRVAENEGGGSDIRNAAMGIGMGFGVGGVFGEALHNMAGSTMMPNLTDPVKPNSPAEAPSGAVLGTAGPKEEAAAQPADPGQGSELKDFEKRIKKLMAAKELGMITEEEFKEKKAALLASI